MLCDEAASLTVTRSGNINMLAVHPGQGNRHLVGISDVNVPTFEAFDMTIPTIPAGVKGSTMGNDVEVGIDVTADKALRQALSLDIGREGLVEPTLDG